jgi:hypothetical protein
MVVGVVVSLGKEDGAGSSGAPLMTSVGSDQICSSNAWLLEPHFA